MRNNIIFFLLVFLIPVSCQKDSVPASVDGDKSIVCQVSVAGANDTKSLDVDKDSLNQVGQTFRMDAWLEAEHRGDAWPEFNDNPHYIKDAIMSYSSAGWSSSDKDVVWTNQIPTNFWAQYPATLAGRGDLTWPADPKVITDDQEKTPSFTYDMSAYTDSVGRAAEATPDLLVAYAREMYYAETSTTPASGVDLHFKFAHALSAIKFSSPRVSTGYSIDSVMITGVCHIGECVLTGSSDPGTSEDSVSASWTGTDTLSYNSSFSQFLGTHMASYDPNKYIFLIPQTLTSKAKMIAYVSVYGIGDPSKQGRYEVNIGGVTWTSGYFYEYKIDFDPDKHILTVTVDEEGYYVKQGSWD